MNDHRDPETEAQIRRALEARAEETTMSPDAIDQIRDRRPVSRWARPATYAAAAAAVVIIAGIAILSRPDDDAGVIDTADTTTTTAPIAPDATLPAPYPTATPPTTAPTTPPDEDPAPAPDPAAQARAGLVIWPTDGTGADNADVAVLGWLENVLGVSGEHAVERPIEGNSGDATRFVVPMIGEDGAPRYEIDGIDVWVGSPDGAQWFVTEVGGANPRIELVEVNGDSSQLRVTGFGHAFEGTGLLWVDDVGPVIVGLGSNGAGDEFSTIVSWDGDGPVRVRLETGTAAENEIPAVHALAVEPEPAATNIIVTGVDADDVLNVRSGAGVANEIVATLAPDAAGITHTGATERVDTASWWEILTADGGRGWANAEFLSVQRAVAADTRLAEEMTAQAELFLRSFAPAAAVDYALPDPHPAGIEIGGIGVFADAPTPFVLVDNLWSNPVEIDWDPLPNETGSPCGNECIRTASEFLDIRPEDVADAVYSIGLAEPVEPTNIYFETGHTEDYYERVASVVAYVPPTSDDILDWRRFTFAFDFRDGSPTIRQVWLWGWTP